MCLHLSSTVICGVMPFSGLFIPLLILLIYLIILFGILYFFFNWKNQSISLKKEQNDLLREIIKKLESK